MFLMTTRFYGTGRVINTLTTRRATLTATIRSRRHSPMRPMSTARGSSESKTSERLKNSIEQEGLTGFTVEPLEYDVHCEG